MTTGQYFASKPGSSSKKRSISRAVGLGLIAGAADDDPSAIGTYASAGAKLGPAFLWTAPVTLPMMFAMVYLSAKLGQVSGRGLFQVIKEYYPRWLLYPTLAGVLLGNTIEAGADLGGMAAALNMFVPVPVPLIVVAIAIIILALQLYGSYILIRNMFRWLALVLLAYIGAGRWHVRFLIWMIFKWRRANVCRVRSAVTSPMVRKIPRRWKPIGGRFWNIAWCHGCWLACRTGSAGQPVRQSICRAVRHRPDGRQRSRHLRRGQRYGTRCVKAPNTVRAKR